MKRQLLRIAASMTAALLLSLGISAQQTIHGVLHSPSGDPLSGATITVKGTKNSTISNANGEFSVKASPGNTLVISYIGYQTKEISIGSKTNLNLSLKQVASSMNEVVVVGYGTAKKSDLTGAVTSVSTKDIKNQPTPRLDEALQGRAPGLVVQNNSASPNGNISIRIRGSNSINGANDPLIVIDGLLGGDIANINPNDVESIEILKDASSTAIYGSRGANGVVLITTKKGASGKVTVQYNGFLNFNSVRKKMDLLNAAQYAETVDSNRADIGVTLPFSQEQIESFKKNGGIDWQDEIYQNALEQNHQIAVSGGGNNVSYYLSGNYVNNEGVIKGSSFKKYSVRSNITSTISKRFNIGLDLFLSKSEDHPVISGGNQDNAPTHAAIIFSPTLPVYNPDGSYTLPSSSFGPPAVYNPLALAIEPIKNNLGNRVVLNTYLNYNIAEGLTAKVLFGISTQDNVNNSYTNTKAKDGLGTATAGITNNHSVILQNTEQINYKKTIAGIHKIDFTAVFENQTQTFNSSFAGSNGFSSDEVTYNNLALGSAPQIPASSNTKKTIVSFVGRLNYAFKDKYLLSLTSRNDGASVFGENNKWGFFPSAGLAWRINKEDFMKNMAEVSNLKLRVSYGVTGSQAVGPYASLDQLNSSQPYSINGTGASTGVGLGVIGNPDLKWEKTGQFNVGFDLGLFTDRMHLTADYYNKRTTDLLLNVPLPRTSGYATKLQNLGEVQNRGFEIDLGGTPLAGKFTWNTDINFATNKNTILSLGGQDNVPIGTTGFPNFGNTIFLVVGQPIGVLEGYIQHGTWGTAEAAKATSFGTIPGAPKYIDQDHNGKINADDIAIMGTTLPKFTYGWSNNFSFKSFDLNVLIQGVAGRKIYNISRVRSERSSSDADATDIRILDRWTPTNQNTSVPSFIGSNQYEQLQSSRWLEDGSYMRIKVITLGYNLPESILKKSKIALARIYVSGVNLFTFTKYTGFDPEESTNVDALGGIDYAAYPSQKTFTVGLNITL